MSGTDITKLESLLRDCRLEAEIDPSHKERLRHQLLAVEDVRPAPVFRFAFAGGAVVILLMACFLFPFFDEPMVGTVFSGPGYQVQADINAGNIYTTGLLPMRLILEDGSQIDVSAQTEFLIQSKTTDRLQENSVIILKKGCLKTTSTSLTNLPYHLVIQTPDQEIQLTSSPFIVSVTDGVTTIN